VNRQIALLRLSFGAFQPPCLPTRRRSDLRSVICVGSILGLFLLPEIGHAQSFGRINTALQTLVDFMTGTTGRLLGILGVASLGIAAWFGRLSYWHAGEVILGIAIVFGSAEIVDLFAR
jgi:type IV secretion system protein VirB2